MLLVSEEKGRGGVSMPWFLDLIDFFWGREASLSQEGMRNEPQRKRREEKEKKNR